MLVVKNLCKNFRLYKKPSDRLIEVCFRKRKHEIFVALSKLSFSLKQGESLGVIGPNGAGKSTLMKLLTGLLIPDKGSVFSQVSYSRSQRQPLHMMRGIKILPPRMSLECGPSLAFSHGRKSRKSEQSDKSE